MTNPLKVKDSKGQEFKGYAVGKGDFPELEGKIINYKLDIGDTKVIVVGCNRAVGVTLVNVDDKDDYFMCIQGPALPGGGHVDRFTDYDAMFDLIVESIVKGDYDPDDVCPYYNGFGFGGPSGSSCAFSQ